VVIVAVVGMRGRRPRRADPATDVQQTTAKARKWSPVSGIR
jgi:hypothetical protein